MRAALPLLALLAAPLSAQEALKPLSAIDWLSQSVETPVAAEEVAPEVEEPEVAAALNFIRRNACRGISVADVLREVIVSRSTLERKLRHYLGRSPQQEIRAVQVDKAKELLTTTPLPADKIARLCGFKHPEYLHVVFKRATGRTPGEYRAEESPGGG